jgi:hypothetical protein
MKTVHVDGGAFVEPPSFKFHDAYFTVCNDAGELLHFAKNIGDFYSGLAEFEAIKWAVENIKERPLRVTSDCTTAIVWAKKGSSKKSKYKVPSLYLTGVDLIYQKRNYADVWNAKNHSPKHDKKYYVERYYKNR